MRTVVETSISEPISPGPVLPRVLRRGGRGASGDYVVAVLTHDDPDRRRLSEDVAATGGRGSSERGDPLAEDRPAPSRSSSMRPAVVFFGRTHLDPTDATLRAKLGVLCRHIRPVLIGTGDATFSVGDAVLRPASSSGSGPRSRLEFYVRGAAVALAAAQRIGASTVVCQSPYEASMFQLIQMLQRPTRRACVVTEVHGDWRTASRSYGSPLRRFGAPIADKVAAWGVRRSDHIRAVGAHTAHLAREVGFRGPIDVYPAYSALSSFIEAPPVPPPAAPAVVYIGALERTKGVDVLLAAWDEIERAIPGATLTIVGGGRLQDLVARAADRPTRSIDYRGQLPAPAVARAIDAAQLVVVPSRSEGLGRIILEAMARSRPVVGSAVGGIPELVVDGVTGHLVTPEDPGSLASAVVALLRSPRTVVRQGSAARERLEQLDPRRLFEDGIERLAELARSAPKGPL